MYDFYPEAPLLDQTRDKAPFTLRATVAELRRWGVELDANEDRDMRETMAADRVAPVPRTTMPTLELPPLPRLTSGEYVSVSSMVCE